MGKIFGGAVLTVNDLKKKFVEDIIINYTLDTILAVIQLAAVKKSVAQHNAVVAGLILLWSAFPFGMWGIMKANRGIMIVYVLYGVVMVTTKVTLSIAATVMTAASCQVGQGSFQGCERASFNNIPCLANSTCSRDMINAYNDVANVTCEAWSTDDCSSAPSARTSMGLAPGAVLLICLDVFFALNSVLFGFVYYTRLEVAIPLKQDNGSDAVELLSLSAVSPIETPVVKSSYNFRDEGYNCPVVPTCDTMRTLTVPLVANPRPDLTRV